MDPFAQKVAAFAGLRGAALADRDAMPDLAKLRYAGRLSNGTRNEEGLVALISGFFGAPATMESFVGTWLELDPKDTWELGNPHTPAKLGQSCSIGSKVWTRQAKFRFRVGPVGLAEYKRLLPGGDGLKRLKALVNSYMGEAMLWDMNLVLKAGEAEVAMLAAPVAETQATAPALDMDKTVVLPMGAAENDHKDGPRPAQKGVYLGWTTWLGTPPSGKDLDQLYIQSDAQTGA